MVYFRLRSPSIDFWVDARLRSFGDRWLAVADLGGDNEIGLSTNPREALEMALASLGERAAGALLADPQLIGIMRAVK